MYPQVNDCEQGCGFERGYGFGYIVVLDNGGCVIQMVSCSSSGTYIQIFTIM